MMTACASGGPPVEPATYVVVAHDTLYSIAWRHNLDYRDLARWNDIGTDYRLSIGQVLTLRPGARAVTAPGARAATAAAQSVPQGSPRSVPQSVPRIPIPSVPPAASQTAPPPLPKVEKAPLDPVALRAHWVWPTDCLSAPRPVPSGGVLLLGQLGQDIRAASAGKVVYAGSGLRAYGNLVIIKHGETLLSSYAHNRELLVREGQDVAAGQLIARMGVGPHQISALYFEIRINGKPIDPSPYLPGVK